MEYKNFQNLLVWQKALSYSIKIYNLTKDFPNEDLYGLTSQIRRSAISIPSNIAEGAARDSKKSFVQFINISIGSAAELKTQLLIAKGVSIINEDTFADLENGINEISFLLYRLKKSLK